MPPDPITILRSLSENTGDFSAVTASPTFLFIKFIFVVVSLVLLLHSIYLLRKIGLVGEKIRFYRDAFAAKLPPVVKDEFVAGWEAVQVRMRAMREPEWKLAVIEADKLLDELLRRMGYKGKDMGARLKRLTPEQLPNINDIWKAHKVRNLLSHDMNYHISFSEAQWVIHTYEEALKEFHILDGLTQP